MSCEVLTVQLFSVSSDFRENLLKSEKIQYSRSLSQEVYFRLNYAVSFQSRLQTNRSITIERKVHFEGRISHGMPYCYYVRRKHIWLQHSFLQAFRGGYSTTTTPDKMNYRGSLIDTWNVGGMARDFARWLMTFVHEIVEIWSSTDLIGRKLHKKIKKKSGLSGRDGGLGSGVGSERSCSSAPE